jgi:hypothetical protein
LESKREPPDAGSSQLFVLLIHFQTMAVLIFAPVPAQPLAVLTG